MNSKNEFETELINLRQEVSELQKENEDLANNLFRVNQKLRDSERLKGHFISNITNEIVNPFASIIGLAENLKKLNSEEMVKAHRMADLIFEEAFHLDFQLKNIFAVALIEAGKEKLNYTEVNLKTIGDLTARYFQNLLSRKKITLLIHYSDNDVATESLTTVTDKEKMELILKNLVSNSIKYSPDNSVIDLQFTLKNEMFSVSVADNGKGIDPEFQQIVFDRFKQLDEKINSINTGHGLGLSIVQTYAEMLEGKVTMKNNTDRGLRVELQFPVKQNENDMDDLDDFLLDSELIF